MKPVLFEFGPFHLYGYGAMIVLGGILSFWLLHRRAAKVGLATDEDFWLLVNVILIGGFLGGRLLFVLEYTRWFSREFWEAMFSFSRGFSVLGAFAGVPAGVWLFCRRKKISFPRLLDTICVMAPFWHVFGRFGCLLAGCCYGRPTEGPWALVFRDPRSQVPAAWLGVPLYPTQLYEAMGNAAIAAGLYLLLKRTENGRPGLVAAAYFAAYGILRFFEEFYRGDAVPLGFGKLTAGQGLGAGLVAASRRSAGLEVDMFPTLLRLGSFELSTYGVLVACGYVAAILWLNARRGEMGLSEDSFWDLIYWLFGGALLGGKIGFALVERDVTLLWHDLRYGFVFYGGFLGAALAGWIASRRLKLSFAKLSDYFGVALPIGHAIGRLGCLAAGCCYGAHTDLPWGIPLAGDPSRHPTQIYESLANALIAVVVARVGLSRTRDGRWKPGSAFLLYIALYASARFLIEIVRDDDRGFTLLHLSPSQWVALTALAVAGALAARRRSV